jgi:hypothetical protein
MTENVLVYIAIMLRYSLQLSGILMLFCVVPFYFHLGIWWSIGALTATIATTVFAYYFDKKLEQ